MEESLSFTITLEGGQPSVQLTVLEGYRHPNRILEVPFGLLDFRALVRSAQSSGEFWIVNTTPDLPEFQVESPVIVKHENGKILWDITYEHYEPFLDVELEEDDEDPTEYEENIITLSFDAYQYVSAMYQFCQLYAHLTPVSFKATTDEDSQRLEQFLPQITILWRRFGQAHGAVNEEGELISETDQFARQAEEQWTDEVIRSLLEMRYGKIMGNIDAYLDSLPDDVLATLEEDSKNIEKSLNERWNKLVNSLTEEEAEALENGQTASKFPNSLKLRLMREFLSGNPSVLLGQHSLQPVSTNSEPSNKVVNIASWRKSNSSKAQDEPKQP